MAKFKAKLKMTSECATPTASKIDVTNGGNAVPSRPPTDQELSRAPHAEASENPFVGKH